MNRPTLDVVIPVLNEAHVLERSVATVRAFLQSQFDYDWRIVIVDNGSTDGTDRVARRLCESHERLHFLHLEWKGRGRALRLAWLLSSADAVCYMDVDLSTNLRHLKQLAAALFEEGYDVVTGSRLLPESRICRSAMREFISRIYNWLVRSVLHTGFSDAQCGFKGATREAAQSIVPQVADQSWFFDTEFLFLSERAGFRIKDIPVEWSEDDDSRVKIVRTAWDDIKGIMRLRRTAASREINAAASQRRVS